MRLHQIALLLIFSVSTTAWASSPSLRIVPNPGEDDLPGVKVESSSRSGLEISFSVPALGMEEVVVEGTTFQMISIPGGGLSGEVGSPGIPSFSRLLAIPASGGVRIDPVVEEEETRSGYRLIPVQADEGTDFVYDPAAYARDAFSDLPAVETGEPAIMRDLRVVPLTFNPVQYNPAAGTIKIARRIRLNVTWTDAPSQNEKQPLTGPIAPSFDKLYRALVVNYEEMAGGRGVAPGAYVLICANNTEVTTRLQPLVDWRQRKGYPVTVATTAQTGTSNSSIKAWIQNAYDTWPVPPEYIAIAGDAGGTYGIPTWNESLSGYGGEGDHPYAQLAGGDILADVNIGRLSFSTTTELDVIVKKTVRYESDPYIADRDWFKRACLVGDESSSGYSTIQLQQWVKVRLRELGYSEIDTIFADPFVSQMSTALNKGDTIFSYRGWLGMSGWTNSNTYALTNRRKLPFVVTITCGTGSFASESSCRTEGFLRAYLGVADSVRGGIGAIGTATTGTHTRYNNCIHFGVMQGLLYEGQTTLGAALARGKLEMYLNYQKAEPNKVTIWSYWNNLMGDPAVDCWTDFPRVTTVTAPATLPIGANAVPVTVTRAGLPESDALVCLYKGTETYAVGMTDANGYIELPVSTPTAGTMLLTVTKHDRQPYLASITVAAQTNYVGFQALTIDDDSAGGSSGNGNGQANPAETIEMPVQLKNFGSASAGSVTAILTTTDPYVTITDNQETWGTIAAGASDWSDEDFDFVISGGCPDGRTIRFGLNITAATGSWHSLIDVPVESADLVAQGTTLYNAGTNGILDPGETVGMSVVLRNDGQVAATSVTGALTSLSSFVTVSDGSGAFGTINVGATGENTTDRFTVSAASDAFKGSLASFQLVTTFSGTVRDTTIFTLTVGTATTIDPVGPDNHHHYAFDNTDTGYPDCPTYSWIEIDPSYGGSGTQLPLPDNGTYQDVSTTITLPFSFTYYGVPYTRATICSNGWMVMGSTYLTEYRNWTIPGAGGPKGIIAAFWDDLHLPSGGKILSYYDAANGRFIIEWSRVVNEPGSSQTFEIILYDPAHYPTPTGDGIIVFQYNTVNNSDSGDGYATVGIESPDGFDGLLYTFYNSYPAAAALLQSGRAIKFVPVSQAASGTLAGTVTNASAGGTPLNAAEVVVVEAGRTLLTGEQGTYSGPVIPGTYTVIARHAGFRPDTTQGVTIHEGETTTRNFSLIDIEGPDVSTTTHASTSDTLGPYQIPVTMSDQSGLAQKTLYYRVAGGDFTPLPLVSQGGDSYLGEIPGQGYVTRVEYYVYGQDNAGLFATDPADAPVTLYSFFVAPTISLFSDDMETNQGWTVGAPGDAATTGIWERADPNATYNASIMVQPEDDHTPDPGVTCYITGNSAVGAAQGDNDVDGGATTLTSPLLDLTSYGTVTLRYYRWFTNDTGNNPGQDPWIVEVSDDNGAAWTTLESTVTTERNWRKMEFDLGNYISMTDQVRIRFIASDDGLGSIVEAGVDDVEIVLSGVTDAPEEAAGPAAFLLQQNRPNPFGPEPTSIGFSLAQPGSARLLVFDLQGRTIRHLVDGHRPAGYQTVVWDGRDDQGDPLPSGIYFYRLQAGGNQEVRKLIRIE